MKPYDAEHIASARRREAQQRRVPREFLVFTILLALAPLAVAMLQEVQQQSSEHSRPKTELAPDVRLVAALDQFVQLRFASFNMSVFGISRLPTPAHERLYPASAGERATIANFEKAGWDVVIYTAGRGLTLPTDSRSGFERAMKPHTLSRPAHLTHPSLSAARSSRPGKDALPRRSSLWRAAYEMLTAPSIPPTYDCTDGRWQITARPVRASRPACVNCHNHQLKTSGQDALRVGDTIGVVLYAFARRAHSVHQATP